MHWTRTVVAVFLAAALVGCASTEPASVLAGGPRMIDLYRGTAAEPLREESVASGAAARQAGSAPAEHEASQATCRWWWLTWPCEASAPPAAAEDAGCDAPAYARTAANELELLFPRLPNPDVYVYVPAHLATELRIPVPGYTTAVPLYDRVEYALPGETKTATNERDAARGPSEAPPGASAEKGRPGSSVEKARSGSSPEETGPGTSPEEIRFDASPEDARPGASAEDARLGASVKDVPSGASAEEAP